MEIAFKHVAYILALPLWHTTNIHAFNYQVLSRNAKSVTTSLSDNPLAMIEGFRGFLFTDLTKLPLLILKDNEIVRTEFDH